MYITHKGNSDTLTQYQCSNISQVKNKINELTLTNSTNEDWKLMCSTVKKYGGTESIDYICFIDDNEYDCTVLISYDNNSSSYFVAIEI